MKFTKLDNFEGADFKYDIIFSNSSPKISKSVTFGPKPKDFIFAPIFAAIQIQRRRFQISDSVFKFQSKNRVRKAEILVPNLGIFSFAQFAESDDINDIKRFENFDSFTKKFIHGS